MSRREGRRKGTSRQGGGRKDPIRQHRCERRQELKIHQLGELHRGECNENNKVRKRAQSRQREGLEGMVGLQDHSRQERVQDFPSWSVRINWGHLLASECVKRRGRGKTLCTAPQLYQPTRRSLPWALVSQQSDERGTRVLDASPELDVRLLRGSERGPSRTR